MASEEIRNVFSRKGVEKRKESSLSLYFQNYREKS
jgi:hypothetical protein